MESLIGPLDRALQVALDTPFVYVKLRVSAEERRICHKLRRCHKSTMFEFCLRVTTSMKMSEMNTLILEYLLRFSIKFFDLIHFLVLIDNIIERKA